MNVWVEAWAWLSDGVNWTGTFGIPHRFVEHLEFCGLTLGVAALLAVPLGTYIGHTGRFQNLAVGLTGAMRALPTLGILTSFTLLLGLGPTAPVVSLALLAVPPVLAGVYSGIASVDSATVDAARAQGMTEGQILWRVELPLALPIIVGGLRSATLQVVSTATVAAYVGLGGLGQFIIDGVATSDYPQVLGGAAVVMSLAIALDVLWALTQRLLTRRLAIGSNL